MIDQLVQYLESDGFSIEMEMIAKMAKLKVSAYSVPISYDHRNGTTHLRPIKDGIKILHAWARNLNWKPEIREEETPIMHKHIN